MASMKEKLEELAHNWILKGCGDDGLMSQWDLFCAMCWSCSNGAKHDGYSQAVADLIDKSKERCGPGWWDHYLYNRDYCSRCGMRYKLENLTYAPIAEFFAVIPVFTAVTDQPTQMETLPACAGEKLLVSPL